MTYLGEFTTSSVIKGKFNTHKADGTPITLAGTPALSVYKASTTETTTGVTLTVDYDSRTGLHYFAVDTSTDGTFYAAGNDFDVVITTGTVDSISVVGTIVGTFSLSNRVTAPTTTAIASAIHQGTVITGTADTGSTTTSIVVKTLSITLGVSNQLQGRIIIFKTDTTTANLRGQAAPIASNTTTTLTIAAGNALLTSPAADDAFVIV
jgi:hypothetical protein